MKKLILSAIVFIGMGTVTMAQSTDRKVQKTPEERAQHATDVLDKKLSFTADQKTKVYALNLEDMRMPKVKHVKGEKRDMTAMKARMDAKDAKMNTILNDKQRVTYREWKETHKKGMRDHLGKRKGDRGDKGPKLDKS